MPSLVRFLVALAVLAALIFGGMVALVTFVHVTPRPMEEAIPASRFK